MDLRNLRKLKIITEEIPENLRNRERELENRKWFEYRCMSVSESTVDFLGEYLKIYRWYYRKVLGSEGTRFPDIFDFSRKTVKREIVGSLVKARQAADSIGCKYGFYIMETFKRSHDREWHRFPDFDLLGCPETASDIEEKWNELKNSSLQVAIRPEFLAENYIGLPCQDAYHDYLIGYARHSAVQDKLLERLVTSLGQLPESVARKNFPTYGQ